MINIQDLRGVDFSRKYKWHVIFPLYGGSFLPASVVTDTAFSFSTGKLTFGPWDFEYPEKAIRGHSLVLEIFELDDYSVFNWLKDWKDAIQDSEYCVGLISELTVAQPMILMKNNLQNAPVIIEIMRVIPSGDISLSHSSEKSGTPLTVSLPLTVVGSN